MSPRIKSLTMGLSLIALLSVLARAGEPIKTGPPLGKPAIVFDPRFLSGKNAGYRVALPQYFNVLNAPSVIVFARAPGDKLTQLIRKLDVATAKSQTLHAAIVFLAEPDAEEKRIKE